MSFWFTYFTHVAAYVGNSRSKRGWCAAAAEAVHYNDVKKKTKYQWSKKENRFIVSTQKEYINKINVHIFGGNVKG